MDQTKKPLDARDRERVIIRTGAAGIAANLLLALFKGAAGYLSHSIAVMLDGVNNLSDAGSSAVTIAGAKLAGREPDREHPFGHGRIEYLSAMIIAVLILYAGFAALTESVKWILKPRLPEYDAVTFVTVSAAIIVKAVLGIYTTRAGKRVNSDSLVNAGQDSRLDCLISLTTLIAASVYLLTGISTEAWLGAAISLYIIFSAVSMLRGTISRILGERNNPALVRSITETVESFEEVKGAHDLVLNNYGPDSWNGSIVIDVAAACSAERLDQLIEEIQSRVAARHRVILTAVGIHAVLTDDPDSLAAEKTVREIVFRHSHISQIHGFHYLKDQKIIRFDMVVSFYADDRRLLHEHVVSDVQKAFPDFTLQIAMDTDFAEE